MSHDFQVNLEAPALLAFSGPDAVRFLNGQLTQDVRNVAGRKIALPSCVTDAKGRLQFRVTITESEDGAFWVAGIAGSQESLKARLTRYLIADLVEVEDLSGKYDLVHYLGLDPSMPEGAWKRESKRYGLLGIDVWAPCGLMSKNDNSLSSVEELEAFRIENGVPVWGKELLEGMLPPEALLDMSDISYHKGCYIGQEVISRIKSAGKVNRRLTRFAFDENVTVTAGVLFDVNGSLAGELTSVSPLLVDGKRFALGYVKRGVIEVFLKLESGEMYLVPMVSV